MAIEDLRQWKVWDLTPQVLAQFDRKGVTSELVQRAILRYALQAPQEAAAAFVAEQRSRDPNRVKEVEEALKGVK
jgi:hypothetical protein